MISRRDRSSVLIGAVAVAAGALACLGATGRWVSVQLIGANDASANGLNTHLDGYPAIALGVAGLIGGISIAITRRRSRTQLVSLLLVAAVGIIGLAMVLEEIHHLHSVDEIARIFTLIDYPIDYFGLHTTAGWGLRLCGVAFGVMALAPVIALLRLGSEHPQRAAVDRDDTARQV